MDKMTIELTTAELVERLKKQLDVNTEGEIADKLSITSASLSMKKKRNSSILKEVLNLAQEMDLDLNRLLLGKKTEWISLRDENEGEVLALQLNKKYLDELGLDRSNLVVIRQGTTAIHIIDTSIKKITSDGTYAISTHNGPVLKQTTMRLDGSVIFPSRSAGVPPEHLNKSGINKLEIIGKSVLLLSQPE